MSMYKSKTGALFEQYIKEDELQEILEFEYLDDLESKQVDTDPITSEQIEQGKIKKPLGPLALDYIEK